MVLGGSGNYRGCPEDEGFMTEKLIDLSEVREALRPPERLLALQAERDQIAAAYKEYKTTHGQLEQLMAEVLAAIPAIKPQAPTYKAPKTKRVDRDITVV